MTNKILIGVLLFSLSSCDINRENKKELSIIEVEKTSLNKYQEIDVKEYIIKMEVKDSFVCFFYSSSCVYCEKLILNIINPYIKETGNLIYGIDVYKEENYKDLGLIEKYQEIENDYFFNENGVISISRPVTQVVFEGEIITYQIGYTIKVKTMLNECIKKGM